MGGGGGEDGQVCAARTGWKKPLLQQQLQRAVRGEAWSSLELEAVSLHKGTWMVGSLQVLPTVEVANADRPAAGNWGCKAQTWQEWNSTWGREGLRRNGMDGCLQSDKRDVSYQVSQVKPIPESSSIPPSRKIPVPFPCPHSTSCVPRFRPIFFVLQRRLSRLSMPRVAPGVEAESLFECGYLFISPQRVRRGWSDGAKSAANWVGRDRESRTRTEANLHRCPGHYQASSSELSTLGKQKQKDEKTAYRPVVRSWMGPKKLKSFPSPMWTTRHSDAVLNRSRSHPPDANTVVLFSSRAKAPAWAGQKQNTPVVRHGPEDAPFAGWEASNLLHRQTDSFLTRRAARQHSTAGASLRLATLWRERGYRSAEFKPRPTSSTDSTVPPK